MFGSSQSASSYVEMRAARQREVAGLAFLGLIGIATVLIFMTEALRWTWQVHVLALVLIALSALAWGFAQRMFVAAAWLMVLGCKALVLWALVWFPSSSLLCLLAVPVVLAASLLGTVSGLGMAALASFAAVVAASQLSLNQVSPVSALLLIWIPILLMAASSYYDARYGGALWASYLRAKVLLNEARDQRLELKETQEDLVHANEELARLSDRLSQMYQIAEEARRAKEEFVANVSHELRTPLNMITGFSEMISEAPDAYGVELPPALLADVDVILRNSRHLASLVDDVLDLSQVEAGQMALSREWASLQEIVEEALVAVRPLYEAKGLDLALDMSEGLPLLYCDRTRIRQVVLNLVSNAARFTEYGGVAVRVVKEANRVTVSVADSGPGIAPEHQERIFSPFQQVDASIRRRAGGTGLGLSISKRFVEMHGGQMWLESAVGRGSTFYFSLPTLDGSAPVSAGAARWLSAYHQEHPRTRPSKAPAPRPLPRFVVLEPGSVLRRLLHRYMEDSEVVGVHSFAEAVAELQQSPAQAVVINDPVPGQTNPALIRQAASLPYGTPAIACSIPGESEAAARLGVLRYLLKPVSREALVGALSDLGEGIRTVLLVDDDAEVLQLFGRLLASAGRDYRLLRAPNGQRALDLLRERKPDVMLLDLVMEGMDGYQVLREKQQDAEIKHIPVIAVSAVDPARESILSNSLTLVRSGGLTMRDLITCLRTWSEVRMPPEAERDPGRRADSAG